MSGGDFEDAMLAIQEAASKITSVSAQLGNFEGNQDELLESVKVLSERVANLEDVARSSSQGSGKRQRGPIPLFERNLVRSAYQDLSHDDADKFKFDESFSSSCNQAMVEKIVTEVKVRHASIDEEHVRWACERYFMSLYEDHKRDIKGTKDRHRIQQRLLRRKKQKLSNRRKAFCTPPARWSSERKRKVKEILDKGLDYMSSEESGDDGVTLYRRGLPWLKRKHANCLKVLDKVHYNGLSAKSKGMVKRREDGEASERPVPPDALPFAVMDENEDPGDLNSSVTSTEDVN